MVAKRRGVRGLGGETAGILNPGTSLLAKVASIVVHADEMFSADGHPFDREAIRSLLSDAEVVRWVKEMQGMALAPMPRRPS